MSKLTDKQERFCREYIVDLNATQAAKRAGYSLKTVKQAGTENIAKPAIKARIAELQAPVLEAVGIDAQYVLRQAKELHERCMQDVYPVMVGTGKDRRQLEDDEGRLVFAFNAMGAAKGLEIIGKHIDVQAFSERHDHNHNHSGSVAVDTNRLSEEVMREVVKRARDKRDSRSVH